MTLRGVPWLREYSHQRWSVVNCDLYDKAFVTYSHKKLGFVAKGDS